MKRSPEDQEIAYPNEGDPEARELGHLVGQTAEAQIGVFESGAPSMITGDTPDVAEPEQENAGFVSVADSEMMTTTREHFEEPERELADEMAHRRSDDDTVIVAEPGRGPLDDEQAVLKHSQIKQKEPKEPMDR